MPRQIHQTKRLYCKDCGQKRLFERDVDDTRGGEGCIWLLALIGIPFTAGLSLVIIPLFMLGRFGGSKLYRCPVCGKGRTGFLWG